MVRHGNTNLIYDMFLFTPSAKLTTKIKINQVLYICHYALDFSGKLASSLFPYLQPADITKRLRLANYEHGQGFVHPQVVTGSCELHDAAAARETLLVLEELEVDHLADLLAEQVLDLLPFRLKHGKGLVVRYKFA